MLKATSALIPNWSQTSREHASFELAPRLGCQWTPLSLPSSGETHALDPAPPSSPVGEGNEHLENDAVRLAPLL